MGKSKIEWTGSTWNAIRARNTVTGQVGTFCQKISPGCAKCYAETHNGRDLPHGSSGLRYSAAGGKLAEIFIDPKMLAEPLRRRKPETYFPCSLTDLFLEEHSFELIAAVWGVMAACRQHTFQVLTKRPERAAQWFRWISSADATVNFTLPPREACIAWLCSALKANSFELLPDWKPSEIWPLPNAWLGVSAEDQERADERIPVLLELPAAVRFVSAEPLLGPLDLDRYLPCCTSPNCDERAGSVSLDWVIVGGESGPGARPFDIAWARSIIAQCRAARTACFMKQLGPHPFDSVNRKCISQDGEPLRTVPWQLPQRHKKGGDPAEWPEDLRVREMPQVPELPHA